MYVLEYSAKPTEAPSSLQVQITLKHNGQKEIVDMSSHSPIAEVRRLCSTLLQYPEPLVDLSANGLHLPLYGDYRFIEELKPSKFAKYIVGM